MIGDLPRSIEVNGREYEIDPDFRTVLDIIIASEDPDLTDQEKIYVCLINLYVDMDDMPAEDYAEAYKKANEFIDRGAGKSKVKQPKLMDWEQDEDVLFPAINKVAGYEVREKDFIHWWTFLGFYMGIEDGVFSRIVGIRAKKAKKKKLEKWEQEFYAANADIIKLKPKRSAKDQAIIDKLKKMMDGGGSDG